MTAVLLAAAETQDDQKQEEEEEPMVPGELQETEKMIEVLQDSLDEKFNSFSTCQDLSDMRPEITVLIRMKYQSQRPSRISIL